MDFGDEKNNRMKKGHGSKPLNNFHFDFSLPADENGGCLILSDQELKVRQAVIDQVIEAFALEPSLSGVVHGRRRIQLGKRGSSRSGLFPSRKNAIGGLGAIYMPMDSRPEARYAMELERSGNISGFRTQAVEVTLPGSKRSVFPDFLVRDTHGRVGLHEVKADKRYLGRQDWEDFGHLASKLERWGIGFQIVDLHDMPSDSKYRILQWLHQRVQSIPDEFELAALIEIEFGRSTYGDLRSTCREIGLCESVLAYALFTELLQVDMEKNLDDDSEVWQ